MTKFSPRFTEPSDDNQYYISTNAGGNNPCIEIEDGYCIPNCVGYANGRSRELSVNQCEMPQCNAVDWFNSTSYETGDEPRLGAVICWSNGYGHVGVVEAIDGDTITVSQSNYGGTRFFLTQLDKNDLNIPYHPFMGFIYNPFIEEDTGIEKVDNAVYRLYNPNNNQHFYTANYDEAVNTRGNGWIYEEVAFISDGNIPVRRFYNPNNGQHMYSISESEKDSLLSNGWQLEDDGFMSKDKGTPIYRIYNPNDGEHLFTGSTDEVTTCIGNGWQLEGVGWYE